MPSTKLSGFVDGNLCPSLLYLTKRDDKYIYKKKEFNFKVTHPVAYRKLIEEMEEIAPPTNLNFTIL